MHSGGNCEYQEHFGQKVVLSIKRAFENDHKTALNAAFLVRSSDNMNDKSMTPCNEESTLWATENNQANLTITTY